MREGHTGWFVQKVSDLWLKVCFSPGLQALRDAEKTVQEEKFFHAKKNILQSEIVRFNAGETKETSVVAMLLGTAFRNSLAPRYRKEFKILQRALRQEVLQSLDPLIRQMEDGKMPIKNQIHFEHGIKLMAASLDNPEIRSRLLDYLTVCDLPIKCRQAIFNVLKNYRYRDVEEAFVTHISSALRNSRGGLEQATILMQNSGILLGFHCADPASPGLRPLTRYYSRMLKSLIRFPDLPERSKKILLDICDLIVTIPLKRDPRSNEMTTDTLATKLINLLPDIQEHPECRDVALKICNDFLEKSLDHPSKQVRGLVAKLEQSMAAINKKQAERLT